MLIVLSFVVSLDAANRTNRWSPLWLVVREQHRLLELLIVEFTELVLLSSLLYAAFLDLCFVSLVVVFLETETSEAKLNAGLAKFLVELCLMRRDNIPNFKICDDGWSCPCRSDWEMRSLTCAILRELTYEFLLESVKVRLDQLLWSNLINLVSLFFLHLERITREKWPLNDALNGWLHLDFI